MAKLVKGLGSRQLTRPRPSVGAHALVLQRWATLLWALLALGLVPAVFSQVAACMALHWWGECPLITQLLWREGLELASYLIPLRRGKGREPDGMRRNDGGGGRHFWHVGGPNDWTALRFLVRRLRRGSQWAGAGTTRGTADGGE